MSNERFVYVTYIRTTAETLWDAVTKPEFTRTYWHGVWHDCQWQVGSPWRLMFSDGRVGDSGEVLEIDPPRKRGLRGRNEFFRAELREEGHSQATIVLEPMGETVQLTITHEIDRPQSKFIEAVSNGWPAILASLKSLLETGESLGRHQS